MQDLNNPQEMGILIFSEVIKHTLTHYLAKMKLKNKETDQWQWPDTTNPDLYKRYWIFKMIKKIAGV